MRSVIIVVAAGMLAGCGVELLTTTAIQGKLQAEQLKAAKGQIGAAAETMGKTNIQRAIDSYQAEKGAYPPSLDALVPNWLPSLPKHADGTDYGYDPSTGRLLDSAPAASQPMSSAAPPTAGEMERLQQIQTAVARYAQENRSYPPSLQSLVPKYLIILPKMDSGQDFTYSAQTGVAVHPSQQMTGTIAAAPVTQGGRGMAGVGGAGPMGEVMTGIAMQNQLNSMSNSGVSAAGGHMRRGVQNATQQQNQQQERALRDLGM